jgi:NAD(P)H-hydrate repair Nnr-like enzyme with NAD(P)H-hydrate epimerase domain
MDVLSKNPMSCQRVQKRKSPPGPTPVGYLINYGYGLQGADGVAAGNILEETGYSVRVGTG